MLIVGLSATMVFVPSTANASVFSGFLSRPAEAAVISGTVPAVLNSQNAPLALLPNIGPETIGRATKTSSDDVVIDDAALAPTMGPAGNAADAADVSEDMSGGISFYTVKTGDTLAGIAKIFGITPATITSANPGVAIKPGETLVILPYSGVNYTIKSGDTIKKIAAKFQVDPIDVRFYNNLSSDADLTAGDTIIIPDSHFDGPADVPTPAKKPTPAPENTKKPTIPTPIIKTPIGADGFFTTRKTAPATTPIPVHPAKIVEKVDLGTALLNPIPPGMGRVTQRLHGWHKTAVDIGAPLGTPVRAIADGTILLAREEGYNGGYGVYIILLSEVNGVEVESIYGHLSHLDVVTGQKVSRGEKIGEVGETGDATGYHLHVEVRGAKNPFTDPNYTG